jgi:hypothetical protein
MELPKELILYSLSLNQWKESGAVAQTSKKYFVILTDKDVLISIIDSCVDNVPKWLLTPKPCRFILPQIEEMVGEINTQIPDDMSIYSRRKWFISDINIPLQIFGKPLLSTSSINVYCHRSDDIKVELGRYKLSGIDDGPSKCLSNMELSIDQIGYDENGEIYLTPLFLYTCYTHKIIVLPEQPLIERSYRDDAWKFLTNHREEGHIGDHFHCKECISKFGSYWVQDWQQNINRYSKLFHGFQFRYIFKSRIPPNPLNFLLDLLTKNIK